MSETKGYKAHQQSGLLLNANENPSNLDPILLQEVAEALPEILFNRYPEDEAHALRQAYGKWLDLPEEMILAGSGSDQMLQLVIGALGGPQKTIMTLTPDFGMYDFYAQSYGSRMLKYPFDLQNGVDLEDFIHFIQEEKPDLVLFSNPNNPSGTMLSSTQIKELADAIAPIPLVSDEAYMEFGKDSAIKLLENTPNLYVTRTLSKAFGLAGLRVGFLISSPDNIQALLPYKIVYNLSSLSQKIAEIALSHTDLYEKQVEDIIQERTRIKETLEKLGIVCGPANANYLCLYPQNPASFAQAFEQAGVQIRTYGNQPYVRITIGAPEQNDQVLEIIQSWKESAEKEPGCLEAGDSALAKDADLTADIDIPKDVHTTNAEAKGESHE